MKTLSRLWTGAVAYVSLLVGAGLSMAGNLADTYRTRGHDVDSLDKILAISWPALVILAIEMFVSPRWNRSTIFQVWRWTGCLAIGSMAMLASWTHLHDLLASRGQLDTVAILGPLAIDGMAIMATGLILSTRVQLASDLVQPVSTPVQDTAKPQYFATEEDVAISEAAFGGFGQPMDTLATQPDDPTLDIKDALDRWNRGYDEALDKVISDADVIGQAEQILTETRTAPPVIEKIPADARDLITRMLDLNAGPGEIKQTLAEMCEVSARTAQRWLSAMRKQREGEA